MLNFSVDCDPISAFTVLYKSYQMKAFVGSIYKSTVCHLIMHADVCKALSLCLSQYI